MDFSVKGRKVQFPADETIVMHFDAQNPWQRISTGTDTCFLVLISSTPALSLLDPLSILTSQKNFASFSIYSSEHSDIETVLRLIITFIGWIKLVFLWINDFYHSIIEHHFFIVSKFFDWFTYYIVFKLEIGDVRIRNKIFYFYCIFPFYQT